MAGWVWLSVPGCQPCKGRSKIRGCRARVGRCRVDGWHIRRPSMTTLWEGEDAHGQWDDTFDVYQQLLTATQHPPPPLHASGVRPPYHFDVCFGGWLGCGWVRLE